MQISGPFSCRQGYSASPSAPRRPGYAGRLPEVCARRPGRPWHHPALPQCGTGSATQRNAAVRVAGPPAGLRWRHDGPRARPAPRHGPAAPGYRSGPAPAPHRNPPVRHPGRSARETRWWPAAPPPGCPPVARAGSAGTPARGRHLHPGHHARRSARPGSALSAPGPAAATPGPAAARPRHASGVSRRWSGEARPALARRPSSPAVRCCAAPATGPRPTA